MNELLREIEEDIRRERMDKLWNSFGRAMVMTSIGVVLVTVVIVLWQNHQQSIAMEKTSQLIKGIERMGVEDYNGAVSAFDVLAQEKNSPYYALALWQKARAQTLLHKDDDARQTYRELSAAPASASGLEDLAKTLALKPDEAVIAVKPGSPYYATVREWQGWQLLAQNKRDESAAIFLELRNAKDAPPSIRERATETLQRIAPDKLAADRASLMTVKSQ